MSFITKDDILHRITTAELGVITQSTDSNIGKALMSAIGKADSGLSARYNVSKIFKATSPFSISGTFAEGDIVTLNETAYVAETTYGLAAYVEYKGIVYKSLQAPNKGKTPDTNPTWWSKIHYDDSLYICILAANAKDVNNLTYWKPATAHQVIRDAVIDLAIYSLHAATQPRNIPTIRVDNKNDALDFLESIRDGKGKLSGSYDLTLNTDTNEGQTINYGGNIKRSQHIY